MHHPQPPWGAHGGPWGPPWGPHAVFVAYCAINIPIYWQYLEGFEPNTQYQFLESFTKPSYGEVLTGRGPRGARLRLRHILHVWPVFLENKSTLNYLRLCSDLELTHPHSK